VSKKRISQFLSPPGAEDPIQEALEQIDRLLSPEAEEQMSGAARESLGKLRLPTLDERVRLYLRAVYGKHDFGNEAYSVARNHILDGMAADIVAKSEMNLPEESRIPGSMQDANPNDTLRDVLRHQASEHSPLLSAREPFGCPTDLRKYTRAEFAERVERTAPPVTLACAYVPSEFEEAAAATQKISPSRRPARMLVMLAASICAVAVIGGSATLFLLRDSNSPTGVALKSAKLDVADQSSRKPSNDVTHAVRDESINAPAVVSPHESPRRVAGLDDPSVMNQLTPAIAGLNSPSATNQLTPDEIADLVKHGRELIAAGKIRDARVLLKRAADAGDANAALLLATTYDPVELEKLAARDANPDIATAPKGQRIRIETRGGDSPEFRSMRILSPITLSQLTKAQSKTISQMQSKTIQSTVAAFMLVISVAAHAAEASIHSIATDPSSFDHQTVTLQGTAVTVKETTSQRGNDYTTFKLQDPGSGDSVSVFMWGHPPLGNGDHVQVDGVFEREHHQGRYTFHNEVGATKVSPLPR
jgi:hypothetical protein